MTVNLLARLPGRLADHFVPDCRRLRNLGRYTFADVASYRLKQGRFVFFRPVVLWWWWRFTLCPDGGRR